MLVNILFLLASYLIGSIPFAFLSSKYIKGIDIRTVGSQNVGATNTLGHAGKLAGTLALIGDIGKGILVIFLAQHFIGDPFWVALSGFLVVLGHDFPVFLKFKGGKGVATTGGVLIGLDGAFALIIVLLWALTILVTRFYIMSSLIIIGLIPVFMLVMGWQVEYAALYFALWILALYVHRFDIQRQIEGKESTVQEYFRKYKNNKLEQGL